MTAKKKEKMVVAFFYDEVRVLNPCAWMQNNQPGALVHTHLGDQPPHGLVKESDLD